MMDYAKVNSPAHNKNTYTCPHCGLNSQMEWMRGGYAPMNRDDWKRVESVDFVKCSSCHHIQIWYEKQILFPNGKKMFPEPFRGMPENVLQIYDEARTIASKSPRSAAALLRLCMEVLLNGLGYNGRLVDAIDKFGRDSPINKHLIEAAHAVRLAGNKAVHTSEIEYSDPESNEIVYSMFVVINLVVKEKIAIANEIQEFTELVKRKFSPTDEPEKEGI